MQEAIENENYVIGTTVNSTTSPVDAVIYRFKIEKIKNVKYLPQKIGVTFPNLTHLTTSGCGLTTIEDFYFQNMQNLHELDLSHNKITTIENYAFENLVKVKTLWLNDNEIRFLNLFPFQFHFLQSVELISLKNNRIERFHWLHPSSFNNDYMKLQILFLEGNNCINDTYFLNWDKLVSDLWANCTEYGIALRSTSTAIPNVLH